MPGSMSKGSHSSLGEHRGMACPECGVIVRLKDPFLWFQGNGQTAKAWHFDCKRAALKRGEIP